MSGIDADVVRNYCRKVPPEIRDAIAPLSNDKAWAVFAALLTHESMSFTRIKALFRTDSSGDINRYLKALTTAGLIDRRAPTIDGIGDGTRSIYAPTALGRSLMRGLYSSVLPHPRMEHVVSREYASVSLRRFGEHGSTPIQDYSAWSSTDSAGHAPGRMSRAGA